MKKVLFLMLSVLIMTSCAVYMQSTTLEPFIKVIEVDATQNELFVRANLWMVQTFRDAKSVIQYTDKDEGTLGGKYYMLTAYSYQATGSVGEYVIMSRQRDEEYDIYATIMIRIKGSRCSISITPIPWKYKPIYLPDQGESYTQKTLSNETLNEENISEKINTLLDSFEKGMKGNKTTF
jgi:hypothetical protein